MSYNGQLNFGLTADFDALSDVDVLAEELRGAIEEIAAVAAAPPPGAKRRSAPSRRSIRAVR